MWRTLWFLLIGVLIGIVGDRYYKPTLKALRPIAEAAHLVAPKQRVKYKDEAQQKNPLATSCPDLKSERVAVLLTAGQSLAANYGHGEAQKDDPRILNFFGGKCFVARDPLLGATGKWQSPWILTGQKLIASGRFDKVVIIATAVGGTGIEEWTTGGDLHRRLIDRSVGAKRAALSPTHFLWHQGEHDANVKTPPDFYAGALRSIIADVRVSVGTDIPAFIALASRCQARPPSEEIRGAQRIVADSVANTFIAIDSDEIGFANRYDGCHMTGSGLEKMAAGYADAILSETPRKPLPRETDSMTSRQ